ncbi:MAG: NYN domain-containing protein [Rhodothermales bacterium]|nr:NYN domain-containing protein [Rhodothermales bacterium]
MRTRSTPYNSVDSAALFVDYDDLHQALSRQVGDAHEAIERLIRSVSTSICGRSGVEVVSARAYADFSVFDNGSTVQHDLTQMGCDPKFTDSSVQLNAPELQLCVDAVRIGTNRPEIGLFVVITGNRPYLPLLQHLRASGKQIVLVGLRLPPARDLAGLGNSHFVDAARLLTASRKATPEEEPMPSFGPGLSTLIRDNVEHVEVEDFAGLEALRIIEEHFGHYDEVYLTPLLRKLTEELDETSDDPKTVIADLEKLGAVWLEKRTGYPYDYTVLLIDRTHPTVSRIREEIASADNYDEDAYSDDDQFGTESREPMLD